MEIVNPEAVQNLFEWIEAEMGRNYRKYVVGQLSKTQFEMANMELLKLYEVVQQQVKHLAREE